MSLYLGDEKIEGVRVDGGVKNGVSYDPQTPTTSEQTQARTNIDAASNADISKLSLEKADEEANYEIIASYEIAEPNISRLEVSTDNTGVSLSLEKILIAYEIPKVQTTISVETKITVPGVGREETMGLLPIRASSDTKVKKFYVEIFKRGGFYRYQSSTPDHLVNDSGLNGSTLRSVNTCLARKNIARLLLVFYDGSIPVGSKITVWGGKAK